MSLRRALLAGLAAFALASPAAAMGTEGMAESEAGRIVANPPEQAQCCVAAEVTCRESLLRGRISPAR